MNDTQFKKTGKNVTVSRDDLINAMFEKLNRFDSLAPSAKSQQPNPYVDPVNIKTANGKMVQVPRYIQNKAIVQWRSNKLSPHTRLNSRKRYADSDPYIMNRDLNVIDRDLSRVEGNRHILDRKRNYIPVDRDLRVQRAINAQQKRSVGQVHIPTERHGDLPRDYEIFNERIDKRLGSGVYVGQIERSSQDFRPNGFYDHEDSNAFPTFDDYEGQIRQDIRQDRPRRIHKNRHALPQVHDEIDEVYGVEGDIQSEAESALEERIFTDYAPIDDIEDQQEGQFADQQEFEPELVDRCTNCDHEHDDYEYENEYEDEIEYENEENDEDEPIESIESMDASDETYKYLFFLLLIIVIVFILYNYRNNRINLL